MKLILLLAAAFSFFNWTASEYQPNIIPTEGGLSGDGRVTTYWDCCKPSCGWVENINTRTQIPVTTCAKDGVTPVSIHDLSGCGENGTSYMCNNQTPFPVNSTLAYGFAAASFTGGADVQLCCGCFLLSFQDQIADKKLLVQVTNTGGDLTVNQFDLAMPGGGVGLFTRGCSTQWNAPENGWGERYGGVSSESGCDGLPPALRSGCRFRFEFLKGFITPVTFNQVQCPAELVALSGCEL